MRPSQFTARFQRLLIEAEEQVRERGLNRVEADDLLLSLLLEEDAPGVREFHGSVDVGRLAAEVESQLHCRELEKMESSEPEVAKNRLIERAVQQAQICGHRYVGSEHLLLALIYEPGIVLDYSLRELGHDPKALYSDLLKNLRFQ